MNINTEGRERLKTWRLQFSEDDWNLTGNDKLSFRGVKKYIMKAKISKPILFVIQNVKTFPTEQLNDLIHLMRKYWKEHNLQLNLVLGIQTNSLDYLNNSLNINSGLKLIVKKFQFPSMKKILLEVIYWLMITSSDVCYFFGTKFLQILAQEITVIGLSLEKFKWMLHFVLAEFYFENKLFFVNISPMTFWLGDGKVTDPWPFK